MAAVIVLKEVAMKYLCLAYGAEHDWKALDKEEQDALLAQDDVIRRRGALMGPTACRIRSSLWGR
jgi:hypothetical protein